MCFSHRHFCAIPAIWQAGGFKWGGGSVGMTLPKTTPIPDAPFEVVALLALTGHY